jgi:catechol 2,3-dioxygenase-like lactoylglutathione lyase family enzyme
MILGLRTVIYRVGDLDRAKTWYAKAFGVEPYFDQSFYVGFNIGGFELGLDPDLSEGSPGPPIGASRRSIPPTIGSSNSAPRLSASRARSAEGSRSASSAIPSVTPSA